MVAFAAPAAWVLGLIIDAMGTPFPITVAVVAIIATIFTQLAK